MRERRAMPHHVGVAVTINEARDWVRAASKVAALTGAGISAESGVPTFRGPGGLWKNRRPETLATFEAFRSDPALVWEWYNWRRERLAAAVPNPGHLALAALEPRKPHFTLVTQNVDGLHDRAGSHRVLKLHGDIWRLRCLTCGSEWPDRRTPLPKLPPHCQCGGMARPAVVWFGESLGPVWGEAESAAQNSEVLVVAGTSAVVYPAASLITVAKEAGAKVIEVNLEETPFSELVDCSLRGACGELLPQLLGE